MSTDQVAVTGAQKPNQIDAGVWSVVTVVILGTVMGILDTTIVNVALDSLARDLHSSLGSVQWVVTGYLLSVVVVMPLTAWAARRFGAKRVYLTSLVMFTLGSALCGLATSSGELIAFRVIQGVGGGALMPVGQMILVKVAGPRNLPRVMSVYGVPIILAPVLGPTLGALLIANAGWRWIFYVNVPIGALAIASALRRLPSEPPEDTGRADLLGIALVAAGLVGLTYGLSEVGSSGDGLTQVTFPVVGGFALVAAFVLRSLRVRRPLLDMHLYSNTVFSAAAVTTFCLGASLYAGMVLTPLYLQVVRHQSVLHTGLLIAPRGVGAALGAWATGRMTDRPGVGPTAAIGVLVTLLFSIPLALLGAHTSYVPIIAVLVIQGFGIGLAMTPVMTAAFRAVRPEQAKDAAPQQNILRQVGASLGTAILLPALQHYLTRAGHSVDAQARAFGTAFGWLLAFSSVALIATVVMVVLERHDRIRISQGRER
jgi:EmrB/QacA subfamily drug resistance transporter